MQRECGLAILGMYLGVPRFGVAEKISQEKVEMAQVDGHKPGEGVPEVANGICREWPDSM